MNFVRRREVKGIKKNVEKENEKRMNMKKKKGKKREEGILFCSRRGNRSDFEIPRDSANCDLQCGKRKTSPPPASSHNSNNARNECWTRNKNYFLMQRRNTKILLIFTNSNILYHFEHEYFIVKRNIEPLLFFSYKFFFLRFWLSIEINKMRTINFDWTRLRSILIRNSSKLLESLQPLPLFHRARISSMYKPRLIFNIFANE